MDAYRGLTFEVELDPQVEPFLRDHALDGTPLLPGVMGIEGFAEVATLIVSELGSLTSASTRPHVSMSQQSRMCGSQPSFKFYRQQPRKVIWRAIVAREGALSPTPVRESVRDCPTARPSDSRSSICSIFQAACCWRRLPHMPRVPSAQSTPPCGMGTADCRA